MNYNNKYLNEWVQSVANLTKPDHIVWINGSEQEYKEICMLLVARGEFIPLNSSSHPGCFLSRSHPSDVARVEDRTFICSQNEADAGPTNNWHEPREMYRILNGILEGSMSGKTMYVVPYLMGPDGSRYSRVGFELTDSAYVVANMRTMARIGDVALKNLPEKNNSFVRGIHSVASLNPEERYIAHFPEDNAIISVNSNYGGNALQGKKCFALRMASILGRKEGWLAEHMLILAVTNPAGKKHYMCAAFPSGCGKTNLAMLVPPEKFLKEGYKIETVGDDIAWLNIGEDGRLYAINPEAGFFGIAPGTSTKTNPNALASVQKNTIFTNTALNPENMTPWWEGLSEPPPFLVDWMGNDWRPKKATKAAHPNSRFTAPAKQCPSIDPNWESPNGVPISAIIFGGRRAKVAPLIVESFNWNHGVYLGATMSSETTAAAEGQVGRLRRDPMAMSPFIGYNASDYLAHWLSFAKKSDIKLPRIYHVNWFKTGSKGEFLWPGFGENIRVLNWIVDRIEGKAKGVETPLGIEPAIDEFNIDGTNITKDILKELLLVKKEDWKDELKTQKHYFKSLGEKFPEELWAEFHDTEKRMED